MPNFVGTHRTFDLSYVHAHAGQTHVRIDKTHPAVQQIRLQYASQK